MKKYFLFFMVFTLLLTAVMLSACKRENGKVSVLGTPAGSSETAGQSTDKSGRPEKTGSLAADTDSSLNPSATTSVSMHPTSGSTVAATDVSGTSNTPEGGTADRASPSGKTPQMSPTGQNTPTPAPTPTSTPVPEVKAVKFSAEGGIYAAEFKLTISAPSGYIIYYTLDGSDPAVNGKRYTAPLTISQSASRAAGTLTKLVSKNLGYSNPSRQMIGTVVRACAKKARNVYLRLRTAILLTRGWPPNIA